MRSFHSLELDQLDIGDVVLCPTTAADYKLVAIGENEVLASLAYRVYEDRGDNEQWIGDFIISVLTIGKPIRGIQVPQKAADGTLCITAKLETEDVRAIELYEV